MRQLMKLCLFKGLGISTTQIYVTFTALAGHIYEIYDTSNPSAKFDAKLGEHYIEGLDPGTEYTLKLKVTRKGLSNEFEFQACTIQLPPTGFNYNTYGVWNAAQLTWNSPHVTGGTADGFKITSTGETDITPAFADTSVNVTLLELTTHTFELFSERTCANADVMTSSVSSVTVQGGIEDFAITKEGRSETTMMIDVNTKNSETTFTCVRFQILRN